MTEEQFREWHDLCSGSNSDSFDEYTWDQEEVDKSADKALNALKTIRNVAELFDCCDPNVRAVSRLFCPSGLICGTPSEKEYKAAVFSLLAMKVDNLL